MAENRSRVLRGCCCAALGGICWGVSGTCGQYLFAHYHVSTLWLTCLRLLSAGLLLLLLALPSHARELRKLPRHPKDLLLVAAYGIGGLTLCQYSYMTGITYANAATITVLQMLSILFVTVISCLLSRRRPRTKELLAVFLAMTGTFLLVTGGNPRQMILSPEALFWGLSTAVAVTVYTLLGKPLLSRWSREVVMGLAMAMGGVVLNLAAKSWSFHVSLPLKGWLLVALIVVLGTVVSFSLFMQGIRDAGPVRAAILGISEPVSAALLGVLWLGDRFSLPELLGFAAIIATVFLLTEKE